MLMRAEWAKFEAACFPGGVGEVQRREMRRAFYAGAQSILFRVIESFAPESEPTAEDLQIMTDLHQELSDFADDVKAGRA
jgi:hypothetical protein